MLSTRESKQNSIGGSTYAQQFSQYEGNKDNHSLAQKNIFNPSEQISRKPNEKEVENILEDFVPKFPEILSRGEINLFIQMSFVSLIYDFYWINDYQTFLNTYPILLNDTYLRS